MRLLLVPQKDQEHHMTRGVTAQGSLAALPSSGVGNAICYQAEGLLSVLLVVVRSCSMLLWLSKAPGVILSEPCGVIQILVVGVSTLTSCFRARYE